MVEDVIWNKSNKKTLNKRLVYTVLDLFLQATITKKREWKQKKWKQKKMKAKKMNESKLFWR